MHSWLQDARIDFYCAAHMALVTMCGSF